MLLSATFTLEKPLVFAAACALALAAVAIAWRRRPAVARLTVVAGAPALLLLALAAGELTWHRPASSADVVVMVDLSASTRGASYRQPGALQRRVKELIGDTPCRVIYFAQQNSTEPPAGSAHLADMPGDRTVYAPPAAAAVVLFSDGRFAPPALAPPTFVVADAALDQPGDAAVSRLERRGDDLAATVRVEGKARQLALAGAAVNVDPGELTIVRPLPAGERVAAARVDGADRWPENDALSIPLAPPMRTQRWWVSTSRAAPPGDWVAMAPDKLPTDAAAWLAPGVLVLDNLSADDLPDAPMRRLEQYVRDLGGALVIGGGQRAFAGGFYPGTALETLSPLASSPPRPAVHWMLLADSSGSMSQTVGAGGATRWELAVGAVTRLLPNLPPDDAVSVGSFAAELTWWVTGRSAREVAGISLPPAGAGPNGPTNLEPALARIAREALPAGGPATELLVVSDADTTFERPDEIASALKTRNVRLHVLAIGDGRGLDALQRVTAATGGTLRRELDPRQWAAQVRRLLEAAWPKRVMSEPARATFTGELAALPGREVAPWNRTWLKERGAAELARTQAGAESIPLAARWSAGGGEVVALAFAPTPAEVEAISTRIARPPRDPRFGVTWDPASRLTVRVDAANGAKYLNGMRLRVELAPADQTGKPLAADVPQVAPGQYEASLDAPRAPSFATLLHDGRVLDRIAVAGRYTPEFDAIGNDHDAMAALAQQTGGALIDRASTRRIDLPFPRRELPLGPWLALAAAAALAIGLARWRYG
jgi:hypothetical protein